LYQPKFRKGSDAYEYLASGVLPKGVRMTVAEAMGLMFAFGMFLLALLTYIDRNQKNSRPLGFSRLGLTILN